MMTIASIDMAATEPMTLDATAATPVAGISSETVGAFQQALSGQVAENENLSSALREAMVSVSATMVKVGKVDAESLRVEVAATEQPTEATPTVDAAPRRVYVGELPLPEQITENFTLGENLQAASVVVGELVDAVPRRVEVAATEQPTVASTTVDAAPRRVYVGELPLPEQITENITLGENLRSTSAVVSELVDAESLRVEVAATEQPTVAPPTVDAVPRRVYVGEQPLSEQITENITLGENLQTASVVVGELVDAAPRRVEVAATEQPTEVPPTVDAAPRRVYIGEQPLSEQITENITLGENLQSASVVVGELVDAVPRRVEVAATEQPTVAPATVDAVPRRVYVGEQPLSEQITENITLGENLQTASVVVGELVDAAPRRVEVAATEQPTEVPPTVDAAPRRVYIGEQPLSEQITENITLGENLQSASVVVGELVDAESLRVYVGEQSLSEQITENITLGENLQTASVVVGELVDAAPRRVEVAATEQPTVVPPTVDAAPRRVNEANDEPPAVTAEALIASGAAVQTPIQTPIAADSSPSTITVAPVDIVRMQSTEAVSSQVLVQAAEAVADTLLVTPGLLRGQGEVLVQLRPDVLEGTEVKISVIGRQLEVVFQPQSMDMAVMIENCRAQIVQHLASKIVSFNVSVDVRKKAEGRA